jgi:hypothetical protein
MPGLEQRLKRQDDPPEQQAVGDGEHQCPTGHPSPPPCHAAPYAERDTPVSTIALGRPLTRRERRATSWHAPVAKGAPRAFRVVGLLRSSWQVSNGSPLRGRIGMTRRLGVRVRSG